MRKALTILLLLCLPFAALAEEVCLLCGGTSDMCLTDAWGAVYCSGRLVLYPTEQTARNYTVREGTCIIGEGAFRDCVHLEQVSLPDSLLIIAEDAFRGCTTLQYVNGLELPPRLYALGSGAFSGCTSLYELDVPSSLRFLGDGVFAGSALTDLYLYPKAFLYGEDVLPSYQVTIHIPGEYASAAVQAFTADHEGTELLLDLAEE